MQAKTNKLLPADRVFTVKNVRLTEKQKIDLMYGAGIIAEKNLQTAKSSRYVKFV